MWAYSLSRRPKANPIWGHQGHAGKLSLRRDNTHRFLRAKVFRVDIPALIKLPLYLSDHSCAHDGVRACPRAEYIKKGLSAHLLGVGNETDRLIHQVLGEVVAIFGFLGGSTWWLS